MKNTLPLNRKQKVLLIVLTFLIFTVTKPCFATYSGGTGEPNTPYEIANVADLLTLANDANDYNKCFILTADINLGPSGAFTTAVIGGTFAGVFDGMGHKITNLTVNEFGGSYLGLFATVSGGEIKNIGLEYVSVTGGDDSYYLGGLVGYNYFGIISGCYSTGAVTGGNWSHNVGGLVGSNIGGNISNCHSTNTVTCGSNSGSFGGLVGYNDSGGNITNCYSAGTVTGALSNIGGLVGLNDGNINNCFSTSSVVLGYAGNLSGGLVGYLDSGNISNCYATGSVTGAIHSSQLGGLVGYIYGGNINNCYSSGTVANGDHDLGGLVGYRYQGNINSCYFLITSGPNNGYGQPLTDEQMKQQSSFIGWDFVWETSGGNDDIWAICEGTNYPKLAWQFIPGDFDNDKYVNFVDFAIMGLKWLQADATLYCGGTDLTGDGLVDMDDLAIMCGDWLNGFVTKVTDPQPADHSVDLSKNVTLRWSPGQNSTSHDIFFGTDFNDVNKADTSSIQFIGNQLSSKWDTNNYAPAGLDFNTTYYWRIDEVAATSFAKGDVWSFTVATLGKAINPQPSNGQLNLNRHVVLSWSPATDASSHDVYFGTDYNNVSIATHISGEYMGNVDINHWDINNFDANGLGYSTTYYWRIDEVDRSWITKGDVWCFTTFPEPNLNYGLVDWWKFDEGTGAIAYDSAGSNNGTIYGGATWTTGHINGALSFNGSSNYVDCGSGPSNYDNITVSAWMKTSTLGTLVSNRYTSTGSGTWYTLLSASIQLGGSSTGSGSAYVYFKADTTDGNWHHIVYTKDGTNHAIYVDGSLDSSFTSTADISWSVPFYIGKAMYTPYFKGVMDEVRIYNRALTAEEVAQLYAQ